MDSHANQHINPDRFADSAGVPWAGRSFDENEFANDDGKAPENLIRAIEEFHQHHDPTVVVAEFAKSRLLIPLLADLGESGVGAHGQTVDKSADLSIVTVETPDGMAGLPVFTSVAAMQIWNQQARPVPASAVRVALAAASENNGRIILDAGSPTEFAIRRPAIKALAQQQPWRAPFTEPQVIAEFESSVRGIDAIAQIVVTNGDPQSRLSGPEVKIELHLKPGLNQEQLNSVVQSVVDQWASSEVITEQVDSLTVAIKLATN